MGFGNSSTVEKFPFNLKPGSEERRELLCTIFFAPYYILMWWLKEDE